MADVTIVETGSEPSQTIEGNAVEIPATQAEALAADAVDASVAVAEIEGETAEELSADAVAIARIHADRDKEIAETNAAVALAEIEARNGDDEWRTNMQEQMNSISERLDLLSLARSIPQPLAEEADTTILSMTPPDTPAIEESEMAPSGSESLPVEMEAAIVAPVKRRRRAI